MGFGRSLDLMKAELTSKKQLIQRKSESCPTEVNWQLAPTQMVRRVFLISRRRCLSDRRLICFQLVVLDSGSVH